MKNAMLLLLGLVVVASHSLAAPADDKKETTTPPVVENDDPDVAGHLPIGNPNHTTIDTRRVGTPNGSTKDKGPRVPPGTHPPTGSDQFGNPFAPPKKGPPKSQPQANLNNHELSGGAGACGTLMYTSAGEDIECKDFVR